MYSKEDLNGEEQRKTPKCPLTLHTTEGNKYLNHRQFEKAVTSFSTVLESDSTNVKALLGLAKSFVGLGNFKKAREIVEEVLQLFPTCYEAFHMKIALDHHRGDFETSFINFWLESLIHTSKCKLRFGHQESKKAIDNSLSPGASLSFDSVDVEEVSKLLRGLSKDVRQKYCSRNVEPHSIKEDLKFVKYLLKNESVESVHPHCEDLATYLKERKEFWNMYKPNRQKRPFKLKRPEWTSKAEIKKLKPHILYEMAKIKCRECQEALKEGDIEGSLEISLEALALLESLLYYDKSKTGRLKSEVFCVLGLIHVLKNDFVPALMYFERANKIATSLNFLDLKLRALFFIGDIFLRQNEYRKALSYFKRCYYIKELDDVESIVLYKMADCQLNLNQLEEAEHNVEMSVLCADDDRLLLDSTLLKAEIVMKMGDEHTSNYLYFLASKSAKKFVDSRADDIQRLVNKFYGHQEIENGENHRFQNS